MKRHLVLNDHIQHATRRANRALEAMDKPGYDYDLCVEVTRDAMHELAALWNEFQAHLDADTLLDEVEVYTETIWHLPTHDLIQYWRLLPGSPAPEHLFPGCKGAYDFKDAARDREDDWPNAVYVSPTLFLAALSEQEQGQFDGYDLKESEG
jgi:hypothetical protein